MKDALKEVLDFRIISAYFESDASDLEIDQLDLVSFTPNDFEI